jgi:hypothetical protein
MAVKLDVPKAAIEDRGGAILGDIAAKVSFGLGRTNGGCLPEEIAAARLASSLQRFDFTTELFVVVEECEIAAWYAWHRSRPNPSARLAERFQDKANLLA